MGAGTLVMLGIAVRSILALRRCALRLVAGLLLAFVLGFIACRARLLAGVLDRLRQCWQRHRERQQQNC